MEPISQDQLDAIAEERAFADLSSWRKVRVRGSDALAWLHDLITADVAGLEPGRATRSLLLSPTGRIRADMTVARDEESLLLLQAPDQPDHVGLLLGPYVLSSDVLLEDATTSHLLFAVMDAASDRVGLAGLRPSVLGPGMDVITLDGKPARRIEDMFLKKQLTEVGAPALETRRIQLGIVRMGVDFPPGALPAEAGLEGCIDRTKGCFLGQESVAKLANLGHPPTVLRHLRADAGLTAGTAVGDADGAQGVITSATAGPGGGSVVIARVPWTARDAALTCPDHTTLRDVNGTP